MRPDENEDKFDHDPDATGWQKSLSDRIDTKAVLEKNRDFVNIILAGNTSLHWMEYRELWNALAQEIGDREAPQ